MPKLLEINVASNKGSTGRIVESIGLAFQKQGWDCYVAHGARYAGKTGLNDIMIGTLESEYLHYLKSYLFDAQGLGSKCSTRKLVEIIKSIKPDVIHLHNIHGYYINYEKLFDVLQELDTPVVWTLHDCWSFTGHCTYFDRINCDKWKDGCFDCPQRDAYPKALIDGSDRNFQLKKKAFTSVNKMIIVPVSEWLSGLVSLSFLGEYPRRVIHNGIDLSVFHPSDNAIKSKFGFQHKKVILGVADGFGERKGLNDFLSLRQILPPDYEIIMIGVSESDRKRIPDSIIAIPKTDSQKELVDYYSAADVFINPTYEDNFPTTNLEALACGTPVITYNTGGSPEAIDSITGSIVKKGGITDLRDEIVRFCENAPDITSHNCRNRAELLFDREKCYSSYVDLFQKII